ncbi:hypothetical protein [Frateuria soli]|uniref:hypothetical protein n=1 Tax=Frateuria soli TaxID=1542730 RepID=UPI001E40D1E2|nr:hypothetical protein [Frateuria soli]UGB38822.1 hypothetical protein LQ771_02910 [Frateuria soli]
MNHDARLSPLEEREWSLQERALADQRAGRAPRAGDASSDTYRRMAELLAQPPDEQLPADFARRVARRAATAAPPLDGRLERDLFALLVAVMVVAGLAVFAIYGARWLPVLDQGAVGAWLARPWVWALAACLGLSRLSRHWLGHDQPA